jgi:dihydrodipicolinate synthase/N-acetylneuraminate lyase
MFMKDSHRSPTDFIKLMKFVKGRISVFVLQTQMYPRATLGAAGYWSIYAWAGPSPLIHLRNACSSGDWEKVKQICVDISDAYKAFGRPGDLFWRENSHKLAINECGYCHTGAFRAPFRHVPFEIVKHSKKIATN